MGQGKPTWSVVLTVNEPAALILSNVCWHLATGAETVHVYLDWADDPVGPQLDQIPGCRVVRCNAAYWKSVHNWKVLPKMQTFRQSLNATDAYQRTDADWLIHLDADEFFVQRPSIEAELRHFPDSDAFLRLPVEERAFLNGSAPQSIFSGVFRVPKSKPAPVYNAFWGGAAPFVRHGVTAHSAGKAMVRRGFNQGLGVHRPFRGRRTDNDRPDAIDSRRGRVLHFDGLTPLHWAIKRIRYSETDTKSQRQLIGGGQVPQVAEIRENCASLADVVRLQRTVQGIDPEQVAKMSAFGLLNLTAFDPTEALRDVLAGQVPDVSVEAFDAELRTRHAALLDRWGGA